MSINAMKQALDALRTLHDENMDYFTRNKLGGENNQCMVFARETITVLRQAIDQAQQAEPVAWGVHDQIALEKSLANCTSPPPRQPLPPQSPCEMTSAERKMFRLGWLECEAAHGIRSNDAA